MSLEIQNLNILCSPKIRIFGSYQSSLNHFSYTFDTGKIYHIDSDFGEGGWALSYYLSGYTGIKQEEFFGHNKIIYNNKELITPKHFREISAYIGQPDFEYYKDRKSMLWPIKKKKHIISEILKNSYVVKNNEFTVKDFCEKFFIEDLEHKNGRANRLLDHMSGTIWRYSIAMGIANNKKIFCFPQMPKTLMELITDDKIAWLYEELKNRNCIVIIPTKYPEYIKNIIDKSVNINLTTAST